MKILKVFNCFNVFPAIKISRHILNEQNLDFLFVELFNDEHFENLQTEITTYEAIKGSKNFQQYISESPIVFTSEASNENELSDLIIKACLNDLDVVTYLFL